MAWKLAPRPFVLIKNKAQTFIGKWNFRNKLVILDM